MYKNIICLLFFIFYQFLITTSYSQSNHSAKSDTELKSNVIYGTYGLITINVNYERLIFTSEEKRIFSAYYAKAGYGIWTEPFGGNGTNFTLAMTALTGQKNNHLELSLGGTYLNDSEGYEIGLSNAMIDNGGTGILPDKSEYRYLRPTGVIGYRFQKPKGKFIFRTGIGFPDIIYVSMGFCF